MLFFTHEMLTSVGELFTPHSAPLNYTIGAQLTVLFMMWGTGADDTVPYSSS